jgi:hypothetical protein
MSFEALDPAALLSPLFKLVNPASGFSSEGDDAHPARKNPNTKDIIKTRFIQSSQFA